MVKELYSIFENGIKCGHVWATNENEAVEVAKVSFKAWMDCSNVTAILGV